MENSFLIKGLKIIEENHVYENGYIKVSGQKIAEVGSLDELDTTDIPEENQFTFSSNEALLPGFIDVHIHGAGGADTMDATTEALDTISQTLPLEGTTSYLATTITQSDAAIENALENVAHYHQSGGNIPGQAEILGIHLEGPFISPKRAGAQPSHFIDKPNKLVFEKWQQIASDLIKLVTLAPEEDRDFELTKHLKETGVIASIGHSDATFTQVEEAIEAGISHVTHLFNQMRGLHHREPGVVGAAFLKDELMTEIIVDGIHVAPEMVRLSFNQIKKDRMVLITDAIRAKCLKDGSYDLGGQSVTVKNGEAKLEDGTLAGSVLKMNKALQNMMTYTDSSLTELVQMASINPAKELKVFDRKGSIKQGKDADFVILDNNFEVLMTICRGKVSFQREEA